MARSGPVRVGFIGTGMISDTYLENLTSFPDVRVVILPGKHVWSEKPISIDRDSGRALLEQADAAGVLVGVAPDTVLGQGVQTARRAIARGDIGEPLSAQTVFQVPLVADDWDPFAATL
jgi:predicted dehydrogenase